MMTHEPRPGNTEPRSELGDTQLEALNHVREGLSSALKRREGQAPLVWAELESWQRELAALGLTRDDFRQQVVNWLDPRLRRCLADEPSFRLADHTFNGLDELSRFARGGDRGTVNQLVDALAKAHGDPLHPLLAAARESKRIGWPESTDIGDQVEMILTANEPWRDALMNGWLLYWALEGRTLPQLLDSVVDSPEELPHHAPIRVAMGLAGFRDGRLEAWLLRRTTSPGFVRRLSELKATRRMQELRIESRQEWLHCLVRHVRVLLGETSVELGSLRLDLSTLDSVRTAALSSEEAFREFGRACTNGALKELLESAVIARRHPATTFEPMMTRLGALSLREDAPPETNANRVLWALGDKRLVHWVDGAWTQHGDPADIPRLAEREWERFQSPAFLQLLRDWLRAVDESGLSHARAVARLSSEPEWNLYDLLAVLEDAAIRDDNGSPLSIHGLAWADLAGSLPEHVFREVVTRLEDMGHLAATIPWSREGLRRWCRWRWPALNQRVERRFRLPSPVEPPPEAWLWAAGWRSLWLSPELVVKGETELLELVGRQEPQEPLLACIERAMDNGRLLAWVVDDEVAKHVRALHVRCQQWLREQRGPNRNEKQVPADDFLEPHRSDDIEGWLQVRDRAVNALAMLEGPRVGERNAKRVSAEIIDVRTSEEWVAFSLSKVGEPTRMPLHGVPVSTGAIIGPPCVVKQGQTTCLIKRGLDRPPASFDVVLSSERVKVSIPRKYLHLFRRPGSGTTSKHGGWAPLVVLAIATTVATAVTIGSGFAGKESSGASPAFSTWLGQLAGTPPQWVWSTASAWLSFFIFFGLTAGLVGSVKRRELPGSALHALALGFWCWRIMLGGS